MGYRQSVSVEFFERCRIIFTILTWVVNSFSVLSPGILIGLFECSEHLKSIIIQVIYKSSGKSNLLYKIFRKVFLV